MSSKSAVLDKLVTVDQEQDAFVVKILSTLVCVLVSISGTCFLLFEESVPHVHVIPILQIFKHTKLSPLVYLGKGSTSISVHEGNFTVKDDATEKVPLRHYKMTQSEEGFLVKLSDSDGIQVGLFTFVCSSVLHECLLTFDKSRCRR